MKREATNDVEEDAEGSKNPSDTRRKRGRPPRVDTPMECRIKNIMKGLRKCKDEQYGSTRVKSALSYMADRRLQGQYACDCLRAAPRRKAVSGLLSRNQTSNSIGWHQSECHILLILSTYRATNWWKRNASSVESTNLWSCLRQMCGSCVKMQRPTTRTPRRYIKTQWFSW